MGSMEFGSLENPLPAILRVFLSLPSYHWLTQLGVFGNFDGQNPMKKTKKSNCRRFIGKEGLFSSPIAPYRLTRRSRGRVQAELARAPELAR